MQFAGDSEKKLLNSDIRLLAVFVFFALLTVGYVLVQILGLDNSRGLSLLLTAIACTTLAALALGALEVVKHLRRGTRDIYAADLARMKTPGGRFEIKKLFATAFDVSFILVLCFAILLLTMLATKGLRGGAVRGYVVNPLMLCAVAGALALYQYFMTHTSCSELRKMFKEHYSEADPADKLK